MKKHLSDNAARGSIGVRVMVAGATLIIIGIAIGVILQNYKQRQQEYHRKAEQISAYGLQEALLRVGADPAWEKGFEDVPYDGGSYTVTLRRYSREDTLLLEISSRGRMKTSSDTKTCLLARVPESGDSGWVSRGLR